MSEQNQQLINILQSLLLASNKPLTTGQLADLLEPEQLDKNSIESALQQLSLQLADDSVLELRQVAGGYRLQIRQQFSIYVNRLWEERPQRYSRALLETLALIAYRQPTTRGEIEDVRGVAVSSQIIRTLQERDWIRVIGYKEVPGRPAMFATTKAFLDYFNLASLADLPPLQQVRDLSAAFDRLQDNIVQHSAAQTENADADDGDSENADGGLHELSFSSLLAELESMEANLKTGFTDLADNDNQMS